MGYGWGGWPVRPAGGYSRTVVSSGTDGMNPAVILGAAALGVVGVGAIVYFATKK